MVEVTDNLDRNSLKGSEVRECLIGRVQVEDEKLDIQAMNDSSSRFVKEKNRMAWQWARRHPQLSGAAPS